MKTLFESDRTFRAFDYLVSHDQFLLRSGSNQKNIDIIFYDTQFVQLKTMLYGIRISAVDSKLYTGYPSVKKTLSHPNMHIFEIESKNEKYLICSAFMHIYENNISESSLGFLNIGREKLILNTTDMKL